jgi:hypothetical protein
MMELNWLAVLGSALIPLVVGFVWYHPSVFGNAWMRETGMSMEGGNMLKIMGISLLVSLMAAVGLLPVVIHQMGAYSTLANDPALADPNSEIGSYFANFMTKYGRNFRTFGHGAFHGILTALFIVMPVVATSSLYERRSFKYVAITIGYWMLSFALMGGVICAFA